MTGPGARRSAVVLAVAVAVALAACTGAGTAAEPSDGAASAAPSIAASEATPTASEPLTEEFPYESVSDPTAIENPYLPLEPGTYWMWDGITVEDGEEIPHQIITMVTDLTKVVDGVKTIVGYDEDWSDGQLVEAEIFFAAQDDEGNVWRLGEYPEEYENGEFLQAPAWLAGVEDALAGIMMPATPREGQRSYAQGWGPAVDWADRGRVIEAALSDCVEAGCYENVIVVEEWDIAEPLARQLKFHAPGAGVIRIDWSGSADQPQELLELVEFRQLDSSELAELRAKALALEAHAYEVLPDVYGGTAPMEQGS